eukprot:2632331-Pleurochrysis_carterae.AAC.2
MRLTRDTRVHRRDARAHRRLERRVLLAALDQPLLKRRRELGRVGRALHQRHAARRRRLRSRRDE